MSKDNEPKSNGTPNQQVDFRNEILGVWEKFERQGMASVEVFAEIAELQAEVFAWAISGGEVRPRHFRVEGGGA